MIYMIFVLIVMSSISSLLHSMEEKNTTQQIILKVCPSKTYSFTDLDNQPDVHGNIHATLSGFCYDNNTIELSQQEGIVRTCITTNGTTYTPGTLAQILAKKEMSTYPLSWHKKVHLNGNEHLVIMSESADEGQKHINMPNHITDNLLRYLSYDITEQHRNSFDLCYELALEHAQPDELVNECASLMTYIDLDYPKQNIRPGDIIGFCESRRLDEYNTSYNIEFKQFAIALRNNIFLTKCGKDGMLYVSTLESLKDFSKCNYHAKINPHIGKKKNIAFYIYRAIAVRNIMMTINLDNTYKCSLQSSNHFCNAFVTWFFGLRCAHKKFLFRPNAQISGTVQGHPFNDTKELLDLLHRGIACNFLLSQLKQLPFLIGDEHLTIYIKKNDKTVSEFLPYETKKRLLAYLLHDSEDTERQCFDFCRKICLNKYNSQERIARSIPYTDQWDYVKENEVCPGDAVALGTNHKIKHFAVALVNMFKEPLLYISKFGNGGPLIVTTMQEMKNFFNCTGFVLIQPTITKYLSFWHDLDDDFFSNTPITFKNG